MKKKILIGIMLGAICGILDLIPMIIQGLTWDANLGAFSMWIVVGFFVSTSNLEMNAILKGILYSFLTLIPSAFIIGWKEPISLIPISFMTLILGGLLGFSYNKIAK